MLLVNSKSQLQEQIHLQKNLGRKIGFIPTMGALHDGHLSLVSASALQCDYTCMSIFVNPTQFNNIDDLKKYPRTLVTDIEKLMTVPCDIVYAPTEVQIYPTDGSTDAVSCALGDLDKVMDGAHRPGHFAGVVQVVSILLNHVMPDFLYLGQKDFQQCVVLQHMIQQHFPHIQLIEVPTMREANGLAMSSRNMRLSDDARQLASGIYDLLSFIKTNYNTKTTSEWTQYGMDVLRKFSEPEYCEIVNKKNLQKINNPLQETAFCCIATWIDGVRLIDNMQVSP